MLTPLMHTVPCGRLLYALGAGTWSDRHGRKPLLVLAVAGQLLVSLSYGLNYALLTQLDWHWLYLELVSFRTQSHQGKRIYIKQKMCRWETCAGARWRTT